MSRIELLINAKMKTVLYVCFIFLGFEMIKQPKWCKVAMYLITVVVED